jgi:hypothetical protein
MIRHLGLTALLLAKLTAMPILSPSASAQSKVSS